MVVENGAYAVAGAMKAFPNQHALQMHGIRIIGAIGCFGTFECLQALLAAKGDVCLVEAMRAHPKQAAVQEAGCSALAALALSSAAGMKAVLAVRAAEAASNAMKAHAAQEQVVVQGLVTLQSLATHVDGKKALVAAQGADMATMALRTHTRPDVLSAALGTLVSLASGGAGHAQALMKTRGLAAALLGLSATAPPPQVAELTLARTLVLAPALTLIAAGGGAACASAPPARGGQVGRDAAAHGCRRQNRGGANSRWGGGACGARAGRQAAAGEQRQAARRAGT